MTAMPWWPSPWKFPVTSPPLKLPPPMVTGVSKLPLPFPRITSMR